MISNHQIINKDHFWQAGTFSHHLNHYQRLSVSHLVSADNCMSSRKHHSKILEVSTFLCSEDRNKQGKYAIYDCF